MYRKFLLAVLATSCCATSQAALTIGLDSGYTDVFALAVGTSGKTARLDEQSSPDTGVYVLRESDLVAAGLSANTSPGYTLKILHGDYTNPSAVSGQTPEYVIGNFRWNGSAQVDGIGDVTGKVLGGGSSTISGVGAWSQDENGDPLATNTQASGLATSVLAVKAKTDNLPASPAAVGSAMTVAAGGITSSSFAANALTAAATASDYVSELGSGAGTLTDADFENIPDSRTWKLVLNASSELVGDKTKVLSVASGEKAFAIDFGVDLGVNAKIRTVDSVSIDTGTNGGVTFGDNGRDHALAKIRPTGVTAGTYVLQVKVTDSEGGPHTALVTLKVVE